MDLLPIKFEMGKCFGNIQAGNNAAIQNCLFLSKEIVYLSTIPLLPFIHYPYLREITRSRDNMMRTIKLHRDFGSIKAGEGITLKAFIVGRCLIAQDTDRQCLPQRMRRRSISTRMEAIKVPAKPDVIDQLI